MNQWLIYVDLRRNLFLLDKCVRENTREKLSRVLRNTTRIRQLITKDQLEQAIKMHLSPDLETKSTIADFASHLPAEKNDDVGNQKDPPLPVLTTIYRLWRLNLQRAKKRKLPLIYLKLRCIYIYSCCLDCI